MMVSQAEIGTCCREDLMEVGFFFWPFTLELVEQMAERAERYGYAMIGIADTPGNAMDPWVAAALVARATTTVRVAISVTNLVTRHPAVSAAAIASIDHICHGRGVLGIGAGHSGTRNLGLGSSTTDELAAGLRFIKTLLRGEPATIGAATAHLPWVRHGPRYSSLPRILEACVPRVAALMGYSSTMVSGPITFGNRGISYSTLSRPAGGGRTRSSYGRSPHSIATRTAIRRVKRSAPCWLFWPAM
jgi:hypothetical protein